MFIPQTGEVVPEGTDGLALWRLDTDRGEESFFARNACFLGIGDPYRALKTTPKAKIGAEAREALYPTPRVRFQIRGGSLGNEAMKVFSVD